MRKRYYVNVYEYSDAEGGTGSNGYIWNSYFDEDAALNRADELRKGIDKHLVVLVEGHRPVDWPRPHPQYQ